MCCAESWVQLVQTRTSRPISQLSCWATIRFDLWIDFLHWPWTFLIAMNLPDDMDSLLGLARISRFSLWWDGLGWWDCGDPLGILSCRLSCCVVLLQIGDGQEDRPLFAWVMNKPDHSKYDVFPRNIPSFCSPYAGCRQLQIHVLCRPRQLFCKKQWRSVLPFCYSCASGITRCALRNIPVLLLLPLASMVQSNAPWEALWPWPRELVSLVAAVTNFEWSFCILVRDLISSLDWIMDARLTKKVIKLLFNWRPAIPFRLIQNGHPIFSIMWPVLYME